MRLRKKFTGGGLDVLWSMCYLCIVKFNTALTEVMFDGNNLNEIKKKIYGRGVGCSLEYVLSLYSEI